MKTKLPNKGTPEADRLTNRYLTSTVEQAKLLGKELGYDNYHSFNDIMRTHFNVKRGDAQPDFVEPAEPQIVIPEIVIQKYIPKGKKGSPESQGLILGDWHYGEITPTFNPKVADQRLDKLFNSTMRITELHRNIYPVNDLIIFVVGDMTHGENPFQGAKVGSIEQGAVDQVFDLAFPKLLSLACSFRENFLTVRIICVPGNHGRISREAPDTSNFDMVLYKALSKAKLPAGITVELPVNDFSQIVNVHGYKFFVHHGDAVKMTNGVPYFAQVRKAMSWYITYGGFSYCLPPDEQVWLPNGESVSIKNIKPGDRVLTGKGYNRTVAEVYKRKHVGEILSLKIHGIPDNIKLTPEHPMLVKKRGWIPCGNIQIGDYIKMTYPIKTYDPRRNGRRYTEDWAKLVGLYLAEGHTTKYHTTLAFHSKEKDLRDETQRILSKIYGKCGATRVKGNSAFVRICSKEIAQELRDECGYYAWGKKLKGIYLTLPLHVQREILLWWLKGDGHRSKYAFTGYTTSETLYRQMFIIALRLGWHPSVRVRERIGRRKSWELRIPTRDIDGIRYKRRKYSNYWYRVDNITSSPYNDDVYNLHISSNALKDETYNACGVAIHNCIQGHIHKDDYYRLSAKTKQITNGALVSDDPYALKTIGTSTIPSQTTFGIHEGKGVTWYYSLTLDKNYFPDMVLTK
jgi:hypothetical protein